MKCRKVDKKTGRSKFISLKNAIRSIQRFKNLKTDQIINKLKNNGRVEVETGTFYSVPSSHKK